METSKAVRDLLNCLVHPLESLDFVRSDFFHLFSRGGAEITTPFHYGQEQNINSYSFRTIIQFDADIINFVPDPDLHAESPGWKETFTEAYKKHRDGIGRFFAQLDRLRSMTLIVSYIVTSPLIFLPKRAFSEAGQNAWGWAGVLVWLIGALALKRYVLPVIFRFGVKMGLRWAKKQWLP